MKRSFIKPIFAALLIAAFSTGCGSSGPTFDASPLSVNANQPTKNATLTEDQLKGWERKDLETDTIPGMSVDKAYTELIKDKKGTTVIVGVVDSGVDIEHEDLKNVLWTNEGEIPNNGKDDDNNGYIDDVHGWNFLGATVGENLELVRILKDLKPKYDGKSATDIAPADKEEYALYKRASAEYDTEHGEASANLARYKQIKENIGESQEAVAKKIGKEDFTKEELNDMDADTPELKQSKSFLLQMMNNVGEDLTAANEQLQGGIDYFQSRLDNHFNLDFNGRKTNDDVNDLTDAFYGDNDVDGPTKEKEDVLHGTHVAGIIAAQRDNGIGMNGVANNVEILTVRAVPDGDEYDKDIALGIRYAVDNGAKVINTSFGKYYSTHPEWVIEAIKYAAKNDVLIVNAAGNDSKDLDDIQVYPNDQTPDDATEYADNVLTIGALNYEYGKNMVASFSNYGKKNIDIFAPGMKIWSTVPNDEYKFLQGTSMASPEVAGIAAQIRSFYPKLSAAQVKQVIMDSGVSISTDVIVGGDPNNVQPFSNISVSGKIVNLYNALIMASKM